MNRKILFFLIFSIFLLVSLSSVSAEGSFSNDVSSLELDDSSNIDLSSISSEDNLFNDIVSVNDEDSSSEDVSSLNNENNFSSNISSLDLDNNSDTALFSIGSDENYSDDLNDFINNINYSDLAIDYNIFMENFYISSSGNNDINAFLNRLNSENSTEFGTFDELKNEIEQTNNTLYLKKDYKTTNLDEEYIVINKSITIFGCNHYIQSSDLERVFLIKADNVSIKNLNFINSNKTGLAGGVISWLGNNGSLINCNFINNSASSVGGAVYIGGNNVMVNNCNFLNNSVRYGPAESLVNKNGFDSSQIHIMSVNAEGGAIYIKGNNTFINNSKFYNNSASISGGAISASFGDNLLLNNSIFRYNEACSAGAIDLNGNNAILDNLRLSENNVSIIKPIDLKSLNSSVIKLLTGGEIFDHFIIDNNSISEMEDSNNFISEIFLNGKNITFLNSKFKNLNSIESFYEYNSSNLKFIPNNFDELAKLINNTPKNGYLTLNNDYEFIDGLNNEILISKPITIYGNGHIIDAIHSSSIFNIVADNVKIFNITFKNAADYESNLNSFYGGGAIYWRGNNGILGNSSFLNNHESNIPNPDHLSGFHCYDGGAIIWDGANGTVINCIFKNNRVGYPGWGGAIWWNGSNGKVINSKFFNNSAFAGAGIYWSGVNGTVLNCKFLDNGILDDGLYWTGENGVIKDSFLLLNGNKFSLISKSPTLAVDFNFWGDTVENINSTSKIIYDVYNIEYLYFTIGVDNFKNLTNYLVLNASNIEDYFNEEDNDFKNLVLFNLTDNKFYNYAVNNSYSHIFDDMLKNMNNTNNKNNSIKKPKIISKDLVKYYKSLNQFKVTVYGKNGKLAIGKYVKITISKKTYKVKTNGKGVVSLKINFKPGKYSVVTKYSNVSVKNKITVKTTLITKNISKKYKKIGSFKIKLLNKNGKLLPNKKIKIKFRGKFYTLKTNKKGIAKFNLSKKLKVGKYTIKTIYGDLTNSNRITVKE